MPDQARTNAEVGIPLLHSRTGIQDYRFDSPIAWITGISRRLLWTAVQHHSKWLSQCVTHSWPESLLWCGHLANGLQFLVDGHWCLPLPCWGGGHGDCDISYCWYNMHIMQVCAVESNNASSTLKVGPSKGNKWIRSWYLKQITRIYDIYDQWQTLRQGVCTKNFKCIQSTPCSNTTARSGQLPVISSWITPQHTGPWRSAAMTLADRFTKLI